MVVHMHPATLFMTKPTPLFQEGNFVVTFYFLDDLLPVSSQGSLFPFFPSFPLPTHKTSYYFNSLLN